MSSDGTSNGTLSLVPCDQCGYEVARDQVRCPECGLEVAKTLARLELQDAARPGLPMSPCHKFHEWILMVGGAAALVGAGGLVVVVVNSSEFSRILIALYFVAWCFPAMLIGRWFWKFRRIQLQSHEAQRFAGRITLGAILLGAVVQFAIVAIKKV